jgi:uncharacterized protein YyaL (SSP411 family)
MEHESFEKEDTAAIMNQHFVCIKVDREERPDVDQIYMDAVQMLTGHGGWPLNCFVLPDGRPLHGGTYYRKEDWEKMLLSLNEFWKTRRDEALRFAADLTDGIRKLDVMAPAGNENIMSFDTLSGVLDHWKSNFDLQWGGHNWAPKFPMPANWELFMQYHHHSNDEFMSQAVQLTLTRMAEGGIYDQVGGGFARYSVDSFWKVPHFEKMLYDNAQLLSLYANAYRQFHDPLYKRVIVQTIDFLTRELCSSEGGFYSALDADSEGVEGKFYTWSKTELKELLGEDEPLYSLFYSADAYGNWEHGNNILYKSRPDQELEQLTRKPLDEILELVNRCNSKLLKAREKRVRPGLDDKIIACWNGLALKGLADAYLATGNEDHINAAIRCADFVLDKMMKDGDLYRIWKNGKASIRAFAEDYAALGEGLLALYSATGNESYAHHAAQLVENAVEHFYDEGQGMFYFKSSKDEALIARKIDTGDDVIPSANSMLAKCLYVLGFLFDKPTYHNMVDRMLINIQEKAQKYPTGYANWLQVMLWRQKGFRQIIVTGKSSLSEFTRLSCQYIPGSILIHLTATSGIPLLTDKEAGDRTQIYVCTDKTCGLPMNTADEVMSSL